MQTLVDSKTATATAQLDLRAFNAHVDVAKTITTLGAKFPPGTVLALEKCREGDGWYGLSAHGLVKLSFQNGPHATSSILDGVDTVDVKELIGRRTELKQWQLIASCLEYHDGSKPVNTTSNTFSAASIDPGTLLQTEHTQSRTAAIVKILSFPFRRSASAI